MLGDWDAAEAELGQAADADGLAGNESLVVHQAWLAAVRGDADRAQTLLTALPDLRASEEPQSQALMAPWRSSSPPPPRAGGHVAPRPGHAGPRRRRRGRARGDALDLAAAARTAWELADTVTTGELLAMLDAHQPGRCRPCCAPNATWPGPAWPAKTARKRRRGRSPPRSPACAEQSTPYHSRTACSTTPRLLTRRAGRSRCPGRRRGRRHRRPAPLPAALDRAAEMKPDLTAAAGARPRTHATGTPT